MRLASGVVQATGISRSDYYYDDAWNQANHEEFYRKYPEAKGKKVILWAPTFRGNAAMPTLCGMEEIQRVMKETEDRYYWVIKLHPHLEEKGMKSNCDLPSEKIFALQICSSQIILRYYLTIWHIRSRFYFLHRTLIRLTMPEASMFHMIPSRVRWLRMERGFLRQSSMNCPSGILQRSKSALLIICRCVMVRQRREY